eukprot:3803879-Rhodomonas_salina.3
MDQKSGSQSQVASRYRVGLTSASSESMPSSESSSSLSSSSSEYSLRSDSSESCRRAALSQLHPSRALP